MRYLLISCLSLLLFIAGCGGQTQTTINELQANSQSLVQQSGDFATEQEESYRIVSTTVAITEVLAALELDVVGVPTTVKQLPNRYEGVQQVGNPMGPDMEIIRSLKPTHVLSVTTLEYDLDKVFSAAGVTANYLDFTSIVDMKTEIQKLGEMFNREQQAQELIAYYDEKIQSIKEDVGDQASPNVLILMGIPGSYLVATEHSYIGDLVKQLGGNNSVVDAKVEFTSANTEFLHQSNPDVILRAAHGMPDEVVKMFDEEFEKNDVWKHFNAVKNGRVYDLPEDFFGTTGNLAADEALDILARMLYEQ